MWSRVSAIAIHTKVRSVGLIPWNRWNLSWMQLLKHAFLKFLKWSRFVNAFLPVWLIKSNITCFRPFPLISGELSVPHHASNVANVLIHNGYNRHLHEKNGLGRNLKTLKWMRTKVCGGLQEIAAAVRLCIDLLTDIGLNVAPQEKKMCVVIRACHAWIVQWSRKHEWPSTSFYEIGVVSTLDV